ncbi:Gag-pro-like protein [Cucumis melo var. makuwa]|uniref:Gag-pro-like protein n=1 Tax=Cucumis melo var. makuwa TaxID=1194695 RepID=A0A5D3DLB0_CUCMM|nr:Gag-pro-like protein [Cucumis melo var. makuwa]TYK24130.1 Gag-pro-like protein [Cucumis melo var. makuwa]
MDVSVCVFLSGSGSRGGVSHSFYWSSSSGPTNAPLFSSSGPMPSSVAFSSSSSLFPSTSRENDDESKRLRLGRISEAKREKLELRANGDRIDGKDGRKGDEDGERAPYYDRMVGSTSTNFLNVITIGEMIDFEVKNRRITDTSSETRRMITPKKKEEEIHELSSTQRVVHVSLPTVGQTNYSPSYQNRVPQEPLQPPSPKWYDPNAKCEYHDGALKFKKIGGELDVNQNPLPNYKGPAINVVDTFIERYKNKVSDVTTSMNTLFQILHGAGYLSPRSNNDDEEKVGCANKKQCLFHLKTDDHSVEDCFEFKNECPPEFELNNWKIKKTLKASKGLQK